MVEIAAHLGVVLVNIAAGLLCFFAPIISDDDFAAVWDTEQLFIMRVYKADALSCSGNVLIKPFLHIAVTVEIIVAPCRIAAEQESMFICIHTETILCTIAVLKSTFGIRPCKSRHIIAVMQKPLIFTQGIDYIIKP